MSRISYPVIRRPSLNDGPWPTQGTPAPVPTPPRWRTPPATLTPAPTPGLASGPTPDQVAMWGGVPFAASAPGIGYSSPPRVSPPLRVDYTMPHEFGDSVLNAVPVPGVPLGPNLGGQPGGGGISGFGGPLEAGATPNRWEAATPENLAAWGYGQSPSAAASRGRGRVEYGAERQSGYGDWHDMAAQWAQAHGVKPQDYFKRVADVYMNPDDPKSSKDPYSALSNAIQDDVWGEAMRRANMWSNNPAVNELLWKEHYYAKNYGGRDPLEGHPEAVQYIQAEAERMHREEVAAAQEAARQFNKQIEQGYYE